MATFKIEPHTVRGGGAAVCVFDDKQNFIATVCWRDGNLLVISKYIEAVALEETPPQVVVVKLKEAP